MRVNLWPILQLLTRTYQLFQTVVYVFLSAVDTESAEQPADQFAVRAGKADQTDQARVRGEPAEGPSAWNWCVYKLCKLDSC